MIPAYSYEKVCQELQKAFKNRYPSSGKNPIRMVGLLFARPDLKLAQEEIIPSLKHFHHRSSQNIDLFCAGYGAYWENWIDVYPDQKAITVIEGVTWQFSSNQFIAFQREIESKTKWRYSGGVELLLANAKFDNKTQTPSIDFNSALVCLLDQMKKDGAIVSVPSFFEEIFRFAENASDDNPTWGFSDTQGKNIGSNAIWQAIVSCLPKGLQEKANQAKYLAIRDISLPHSH